MSANDSTSQIQGLPDGTPAVEYTLSARETFALMGVRAVFDGTGAGGAFLPCVKILSDAGTVMAQTIGTSVAAGASADVTFTPFLRSSTSTVAGLAVMYDTSPQVGTFLESTTTGNTGFTAHKITLDTTGGTEIILSSGTDITATAGTFMSLEASTGWKVRPGNGDAEFFLTAGNATFIYDHLGNTILRVNEAGTIVMPTLPALDPGVSGTLWNSGGFVAVSP